MTGTRPRIRAAVGLLGVTVLIVVATGQYRSYVRASNWWMLALAGVVLVALSAQGVLAQWRQHDLEQTARRYAPDPQAWLRGRGAGPQDEEDDDGHGHAQPGSSWVLLLAPVACVTLLAPPTLGAYSAARAPDASVSAIAPTVSADPVPWPPLPPDAVLPMTFAEFVTRARWDTSQALAGRTVRLTGFAVPQRPSRPGDARWVLVRMGIMCCAADAIVYRVRLAGAAADPATGVPRADTWLEVEGTWVAEPTADPGPGAVPDPPLLRVTSLREVPVPEEPFDG